MAEEFLSDRDETSFRVLRELERHTGASQRDLAHHTRVSLGAMNHCLRALQAKGLIKVHNFRASDNKLRYMYLLTLRGLGHRRFLTRKMAEYDAQRAEIEDIRKDIHTE